MAYERVNWENGVKPINDINLNKMDQGIADLDQRLINIEELTKTQYDIDNEYVSGTCFVSKKDKIVNLVFQLTTKNQINQGEFIGLEQVPFLPQMEVHSIAQYLGIIYGTSWINSANRHATFMSNQQINTGTVFQIDYTYICV